MTASIVALLTASVTAAAAAPPTRSAAENGSGRAVPEDITAGPDGNLWFTELEGDRIGRITTDGRVTEFRILRIPAPEEQTGPVDIAAGPDGNLWFTDPVGNQVGRITPGGAITMFSAGLAPRSVPLGITSGPDGNIWFTEYEGNRIGRITPAGVITEFAAGLTPRSQPLEITPGPDGNLWFTEYSGNSIGRITPAGVITEFSDGLSESSFPDGITAGPDGNLWFAEYGVNRIGRITPAGVITEYSAGLGFLTGRPHGITAGPDGNLWFTKAWNEETCCDTTAVGRITPSGLVTEFRRGLGPQTDTENITAGADGNLWFTERNGNRIGRITPGGVITEFPPPVRIGRARPAGARAVVVRLSCPANACSGTVQLWEPEKGVSLGARRFTVGAGRSAAMVVPLSARGRRLLRAVGALDVTVWAQSTGSGLLGGGGEPAWVRLWSSRAVPATVSAVVDGDTVRVRIRGRNETVRLVGVDAPEITPRSAVDMCFGRTAAARARELLPPGSDVTVVTVPRVFERDTFGRLPAYLFRSGRRGPAGSVNYAMVATGYAVATGDEHPNSDLFQRSQERARQRNKGVWAEPCRGDLTKPDPGRAASDRATNAGRYSRK